MNLYCLSALYLKKRKCIFFNMCIRIQSIICQLMESQLDRSLFWGYCYFFTICCRRIHASYVFEEFRESLLQEQGQLRRTNRDETAPLLQWSYGNIKADYGPNCRQIWNNLACMKQPYLISKPMITKHIKITETSTGIRSTSY